MKEVEVKLPFSLFNLFSRDLEKEREVFEENVVFYVDESSIVRVRKENGQVVLTFKRMEKRDESKKVCEEVSVVVSDFDKVVEILRRIGLREAMKYRKRRAIYRVRWNREINVMLDEVEGLGKFVEVEAKSEKELAEFLSKYNIPRDKLITKTYMELLRERSV